MENKLVKINNVELGIKEYKKERVVTAWDIGKVHNKTVSEINQIFKNNRSKFITINNTNLLSVKFIKELVINCGILSSVI